MKQHIVVIGGGIAGTAAANHLSKKGYKVTLVEKNDRLGGRIHSVTRDEFTFELGAGFITSIYKNIFQFLRESELDKNLTIRKSRSAVIKNSMVYPLSVPTFLDKNFLSLTSSSLLFALFSKVFFHWNKLDTNAMWKAYPNNKESVAELFQKKNSQQILDYLIQPMLDGYFYWDAKNTSDAMLLLLLKTGMQRGKTYTLKNGLQQIPELLAKDCDVLLSHEVKQIKRNKSTYEIITSKKTLKADGIICATTASVIPKILSFLTSQQRDFFANIHYSSTVVVAKTYKNMLIPQNFAIAYPRKDGTNLGTITFVADKTSQTTLIKLFASGLTSKSLSSESDSTIEKLLTKDAQVSRDYFDASLPASSIIVRRWAEALPEFSVEHFKHLKSFMRGEFDFKNERIVFAGDYLGGPFMEGAFTSGLQAAFNLEEHLK